MSVSQASSPISTMQVYMLALQQSQNVDRPRPPTVLGSEIARAEADLARQKAAVQPAVTAGVDEYA